MTLLQQEESPEGQIHHPVCGRSGSKRAGVKPADGVAGSGQKRSSVWNEKNSDHLRWIVFHTPLNSEQCLHTGLIDAVLWMTASTLKGVCVCVGEGVMLLGVVAVTLKCPGRPPPPPHPSPNQSNAPTPAASRRDLLVRGDSLKSGGEITNVLISPPPETCAKSTLHVAHLR